MTEEDAVPHRKRLASFGAYAIAQCSRGIVGFVRLKFAMRLAFAVICIAFAPAIISQDLPAVRTPLQIIAEGDLSNAWKVHDASLGETITATSGYLEVENITNTSVEDAIFYAEYFDSARRFCFSLVFSLSKNVGVRGPAPPGEVRQLNSVGIGLATSSEAKEVRVYLVRRNKADLVNSLCKWNVSIRAPVTVGASVPSDADSLQVGAEVGQGRAPVSDLILAKVAVDRNGSVDQVDVINAVSGPVAAWFHHFVRQLTFFPATECDVPQRATSLMAVRIVLAEDTPLDSALLLRTSPWFELYMQTLKDPEAPIVSQVLFGRPPSQVKLGDSNDFAELPPAPANLFKAISIGSEWSTPTVGWVKDPSMPHHLRRELPTESSR
jgi:hypothetical protein